MNIQQSGSPIFVLAILFWVLTVIVHIAFAFGVGYDSDRLKENGEDTQLVSRGIWVLATLLGGVMAGGVYWIVHHVARRS
jgi:hypothetical protein